MQVRLFSPCSRSLRIYWEENVPHSDFSVFAHLLR